MERYLGALLIAISLFLFQQQRMGTVVLAQPSTSDSLPSFQPLHTESRFSEKLEESSQVIVRETVYKNASDTDAEIEKVIDEGADGKKTIITQIIYFEGKEWRREIVSTNVTAPQDRIILRGTKIVWKALVTPEGEIKYWKKMRVYATHYDAHCPGCDETTAIGLMAGKGVIAVDPTVIKLRSKVYIPGYGVAVAGDTGGAIKGNIIDLGFDNARTAGWSAKFVDIYLQ